MTFLKHHILPSDDFAEEFKRILGYIPPRAWVYDPSACMVGETGMREKHSLKKRYLRVCGRFGAS